MMFGSRAARAQTINFDVPGGVGAVNYTGLGGAPGTGVLWNPIAYQGTTSTGLLADGATPSAITLTDTSPNNYNPGQGAQGTQGGLEAPYAYENNGTPATETLSQVPPGTYDLYLYGRNYPYANRGTAFSVSVGATSYGTQSTVGSSDTGFTQGNDYVEFTNVVVGSGGTITFTYAAGAAGGGEGDFNGLQLVTVQPHAVNFDVPGGVGAVNYAGPGAAVDLGIYWNALAFDGTTSGALASDDETPSPITLTDTSPGNFNPGQGAQGTPGGLEAPYAYAGGNAVVTETVNNVPPGSYNLCLYGKNYPYSDRGTAFAVSVGATSYGTQSTVCGADSSFILGNDYVEFTNVVVGTSGNTITFTYTSGASGGGEGDFNGLQLVNTTVASANLNGPTPGSSVTALWTGSVNGNWDVGTTANWLTNGVAGVYSQGNVVQFDDTSSVNTVDLLGALTPASVLVNNNNANYILAGPGALGGSNTFSLTKLGSAMLTLNIANTFSGSVNVGGGILQVGNAAALGNGTGITTISNGATLDLNGFNIGNQSVVVQGPGSSGQGAINNTGGAVYPAISHVTMSGDTTLGNSGGTWELKPQSGGTASLSTGGNAYSLTKVGSGFVGLYGVIIDPTLHNIDVQGGSFDLENTTSGSLGDATGTFTMEGGTTLYFYQILNPISKPTVFNGAALSNNNGPTLFTGPFTLNGYNVFGLYTSLSLNGTITGSGELEVQAGSGTLGLNGTNSYSGDIYMDANVGPLTFSGPGLAANGGVYLSENDSLLVNGSYGGSVTDNGSSGTTLSGSGVIGGPVDFSGLITPGGLNSAGTLTVGGLTMESSAVLNLDLGASVNGSNDLVQVNGNLTLNGNTVVLNFLQGHLQVGTYRLIDYTGSLSGSFGTLSTRAQARIDTSVSGQVNLIVTGGGTAANLLWNTNNTGAWDTDVSSNWFNLGTDSQDLFFSGDSVLFNDLAGVPTTVSINGSVSPNAITVNSSVNSFTFNGSGTISGAASLTKLGTSTLVLSSPGSFTGPALIGGGIVSAPGGTLDSVASITITNASTFDLAGNSIVGPKPITISGAGFNAEGALFNTVGDYPDLVFNITLAGDTTFGGSARWDLAAGSQISGPHYLTIDWSAGAGYGEWNTITVGATVAGITLTNASSIGMKFMDAAFQNPATVFTVWTNGQMTFYNGGFNGSLHLLSGAQVVHETAPAGFYGSNIILENNSSFISYYNTGDTTPVDSAITLNGVAHFVIGDHDMVYTNLISGPGGFVEDYYNNDMVFSASNTYSGPTIIGSAGNTPEVALTGNGSISHSALIFFGGNNPAIPHIDVTGRTDQTLTLANGQTLSGIGSISGSLAVSEGAILSPGGTNTTIGITTGSNPVGILAASDNVALSGTTLIKLDGSTNDVVEAGTGLTYGGTLDLVNIGSSPLAAGNSFHVFSATTYAGSFSSIVPATPGTGLAWDLSQLSSGLVNVVAVNSSGPQIGSTTLSGNNLILSGTGGTANGSYAVLMTTNLTTPLDGWMQVATGAYNATGAFSVTNAIVPSVAHAFYIIKQ
jgi:autotransporter-associated beta strand protein